MAEPAPAAEPAVAAAAEAGPKAADEEPPASSAAAAAAAAAAATLDGSKIRALVGDDAAFAAFVDAKFAELDANGNGRLSKAELKPALLALGPALGIPPPGTKEEADKLIDMVFEAAFAKDDKEEVTKEEFAAFNREILLGIADGLEEDPVMLAVLDGSQLNSLLDDEDEFAMLAESVFAELDADNSGKISKSELKNAFTKLGLSAGVPPIGATPEADELIDGVIQKYGHGEGELGQAEFAKLLQDTLTDMASSLAERPIVMAHDVKVLNGARLRKVLNNEELLLESTTKMFEEWDLDKDEKLSKGEIVTAFKTLGLSFGLPPETSQAEQEIVFGKVFDAADYDHNGIVDKDEFAILAKSLLKSLADELEQNPIIIETQITVR
eukprot:SM000036S13352  [mRNA]  locus=s36:780591:782791:- [translate_table: standard]